MRVCYWGSYDTNYPRNRIIREGLKLNDVEVVECNVPFKYGGRIWHRYSALLKQWNAIDKSSIDAIILPEFNHKNLLLALYISKSARIPLIFDPFVSVYNTNVEDRARVKKGSPGVLRDYLLDIIGFRLPNIILADTKTHADYFIKRWGANPAHIHIVYVGVNEDCYFPAAKLPLSAVPQTVLFFGSYIPLHGTEIIVKAFAEVQKKAPSSFKFQMIGQGQTFQDTVTLAQRLGITNLEFLPNLDYRDLARRVREASIGLGIFGDTEKAKRVIPNKVFQYLASGIPVITGDSPAISEIFQNGKHLMTVPFGDPYALAETIIQLGSTPQLLIELSRNGEKLVREQFNRERIGKMVKDLIPAIGS